ncbi:MAG: single-stranded DNA-binding protein [Candidatus Paceibacterota bacterium]|nr:single-stranded DNA-binding protein [Candidatus Paceibacterota bacterium]MDD4831009.1 single-stranded DNA-binding protein [Candidatus Paceibacterota bacterium]
MNLNKVFLIGRVASDPELRSTPSGQSVCSFRMATNRVWKDSSGQKKEDAQFHSIVLWGKQAEMASQYLTKGSLTYIEGRLQTRSWDSQGGKKYITEIIGERIQLGPKSANAGSFSPNAPNASRSPKTAKQQEEDIPIIEDGSFDVPESKDEIDVKDIPF